MTDSQTPESQSVDEAVAAELAYHEGLEKRMRELEEEVHPSVLRYLEYRPLCAKLPFESRCGYVLEDVTATCKACGRTSRYLRGIVKEWAGCIEVEGGGICLSCKMVTYFKMRRYHDGRQIRAADNGWVPVPVNKPSRKDVCRQLLRRLARTVVHWLKTG